MATTIRRTEAVPASYPAKPSGLSTAADALDAGTVWHRIEAFIAHRWSARNVVWIVDGPGEWIPDLTPASVSTVEIWREGGWEAVTLYDSPLGGYELEADASYRFSGSVGGGTVPEVVNEAYRRLAEYLAARPGKPGASTESISSGSISLSTRRAPEWMARAMHNSGAGDLLRPFRKVI